jgi:hypothetical protein
MTPEQKATLQNCSQQGQDFFYGIVIDYMCAMRTFENTGALPSGYPEVLQDIS